MSSSKSDVKEMLKLGFILALFAAVSCTILAAVNNVTSVRIAQNKLNKANAAMKEVFAQADEFIPVEFEAYSNPSVSVHSVYFAKKDGAVIGAVSEVSGPTYDKATIMAGITTDGTVTGVRFLENTDSPGFGLKASDSTFILPNGKTFYGQFEGKNAKDGFVAGQTFDIISGATITSKGAAELITAGTQTMLKALKAAE